MSTVEPSSRGGARRRAAASRTSAEEVLARSRAERAQLEQGKVFRACLIEEAERVHEELGLLHDELRGIYRQLGCLRKRFPSLPPAPRLAGYPPVVVGASPVGVHVPAVTKATA
ncbi:hypothetical protein [Nocardia sp. MW-W600-9]